MDQILAQEITHYLVPPRYSGGKLVWPYIYTFPDGLFRKTNLKNYIISIVCSRGKKGIFGNPFKQFSLSLKHKTTLKVISYNSNTNMISTDNMPEITTVEKCLQSIRDLCNNLNYTTQPDGTLIPIRKSRSKSYSF